MIKCLEHPIGAVNVILSLSFFMVELFLTKVVRRRLTTFRKLLVNDISLSFIIIARLAINTFRHELGGNAVEAIDKSFGVSGLSTFTRAYQPLVQIFTTTNSHHLLLQVEICCGQNWLQLALAVYIT